MAFDSISTLQKNRVYAPIILGVAILLAVFVARPMYSSYSEADSMLMIAEQSLATTQAEYDKLHKQSELLTQADSELAQTVKKIAQDFNSSAILETIMINNNFTVTPTGTTRAPSVSISNITLNKGAKEPSGIFRGTVNMTVSAQSADVIAKFLDYLTQSTPYYFALNNISLPLDTETNTVATEVSVPVTLGLYYYP